MLGMESGVIEETTIVAMISPRLGGWCCLHWPAGKFKKLGIRSVAEANGHYAFMELEFSSKRRATGAYGLGINSSSFGVRIVTS
jgi:hypothetical protein